MQNLLEELPKIEITPKFYRILPDTAGIYVYFKDNQVVYIGKAINLKKRVSSYFSFDLEPKTARMISEANYLSFIQVSSELEALLLEAKLIRTYMPKYNIAAKDDKHPLYIQITKEVYPRIVTARKIDLKNKVIASYGPFPSSRSVKAVLKMIRRIFPYSDHKLGKRGCLYSHLGLCSPCPNNIEEMTGEAKTLARKVYLKNIRHIKSILDGNILKVSKSLLTEMEQASAREDFETAREIRNKITELEYITSPQLPPDIYMQNPNLYEDTRQKELNQIRMILKSKEVKIEKISRIECFDIAHLAGTNSTASMVTFIDGEADKNYYRHFKIRGAKPSDDYGALGEVARRRSKHFMDWGLPDLIIVDGGVGQVKSFTGAIHKFSNKKFPIVGIAKHPDRLIIKSPNEMIHKVKLEGAALNLVSRMRDEAHRFARRYHHRLISKSIREA